MKTRLVESYQTSNCSKIWRVSCECKNASTTTDQELYINLCYTSSALHLLSGIELARRQHNDIHQHEMNAIILYIFPSKLAYNKAKAQREQCVGSNKRSVHRSVRYACIPAQTFSDQKMHIITATCVLSLQRSLQGLQRYSIDSKTTSIISTLQFLPVGRFILVLEGPFCAQYICRH